MPTIYSCTGEVLPTSRITKTAVATSQYSGKAHRSEIERNKILESADAVLLDMVSTVSLSLSHWYPGSGVVLVCNDS